MNYKIVIFTFLYLSTNYLYAQEWSTDDWGQWINEELDTQDFSDESFDQLNALDGIEPEKQSTTTTNKQLLPSDILFQLWQLESGLQFVDMDQLTDEEKSLYTKWLEHSEYEVEQLEPIDPNELIDYEDKPLTPSKDLSTNVDESNNQNTPATEIEPADENLQSNYVAKADQIEIEQPEPDSNTDSKNKHNGHHHSHDRPSGHSKDSESESDNQRHDKHDNNSHHRESFQKEEH